MEFTVKCVTPPNGCEAEISALNEAFNILADKSFSPNWISQEDCLHVQKQTEDCVYVMDPFDGPAFEHLRHLGCRIFGPQCIMSSMLLKMVIPRKKHPVYNVAMKDVVVSCTSLDKETRDMVHLLVEQMGGDISRSLTADVTHLIAGGVGSQKYLVACRQGMHVMTAEWVQAVWERARHGHIHATDDQFSRFKCPVFKGLVVCVSGLDAEERKSVKRYVEQEGNKYEHARKWNIHIVSLKWLYDSLDNNFCQSEEVYIVQPTSIASGLKTSTPERTHRSALAPNIADISAISMCSTHVNDTALQTTRFCDPTADSFDTLDLTSVPAEPFLDGCKIYLSGVTGAVLEKLRRIINSAGGTRFNAITDRVTHIVMGDRCEADLAAVKEMEHRKSLRTKSPSTESTPQKEKTAKSHVDNESDMAELLSQYLDTGARKLIPQFGQAADEVDGHIPCMDQDDADLTQPPESQSMASETGIFQGKTFIICGFNDEVTTALGSHLLHSYSHGRRVPDFTVVPVQGSPTESSATEVVTNAWMQMCLESQTWLPINSNPIFQPIGIDLSSQPLQNCVLSISGYVGVERDCLNHIADLLGAVSQEFFVRKARKNLLASTHLIVKEATGSKFKAAKDWGIPAMTKELVLQWQIKYMYISDTVELCTALAGQNVDTKGDQQSKDSSSLSRVHQIKELKKGKPGLVSENQGSSPNRGTIVAEQRKEETEKAKVLPSSPVAPKSLHQKNSTHLSQKENVGATVTGRGTGSPLRERVTATPTRGKMAVAKVGGVQAAHNRVEELLQQEQKAILSPGNESPRTYLAPGYKPKYNLTGVLDYYKTPEGRRESLPLEDFVSKCMMEGVKNTANSRIIDSPACSSQTSQAEQRGALEGVVISGRINDANKELRQAKNQGKIIVSPCWLYACMEQKARVDESLYPHNYNPSLNLGDIVMKDAPSKALRRSTRHNPKETPNTAKTPTQQPQQETAWQESMKAMSSWQGVAKDPGNIKDAAGSASTVEMERAAADKDDNSCAFADEKEKNANRPDTGLTRHEDEQMKEAVTGGSLDVREALGQTVETLKNTSKSKRSGKKRSRRADGSCGQQNVSGSMSGNNSDSGHPASPWLHQHAPANLHALQMDSHPPEVSQSIQITWDDPIGRQEEEKLADQLDHSQSHTQNTEDFMAEMEMPDLDTSVNSSLSEIKNKPTSRLRPQVGWSPTPEHPLIVKATVPQPCVESPDSCQRPCAPPIILISGMAQQERLEYGALVEKLGGQVLDRQHFDTECTHLVVGQPTRNEKFLAAVATGRWVLHKSYFIACQQEQNFVREEDHEWGGPATASLLQNLSSQTQKLAAAAFKWRQKLQQMKKSNPACKGAYQDWQVVLLTDKARENNFRRLLSAGGATVLNIRPPLKKDLKATHAFVDFNKMMLSQDDINVLATGVTHCLKPEYIAAHLTDDSECSIAEYTLPEIAAVTESMADPSGRKRKIAADDTGERKKRSRR
ncbi:hypothetical protein C0Q70_04152 [Pomacea canaliculata]|uniref:BRCT domain-containing protein n=1 Tax=Pomacea canaliculata TaxID=400727 RepID=A0A2T7PUV1_POMCA|nr:hypothetical protein C0Q70_04152 [Pomacea canaliculata]